MIAGKAASATYPCPAPRSPKWPSINRCWQILRLLPGLLPPGGTHLLVTFRAPWIRSDSTVLPRHNTQIDLFHLTSTKWLTPRSRLARTGYSSGIGTGSVHCPRAGPAMHRSQSRATSFVCQRAQTWSTRRQRGGTGAVNNPVYGGICSRVANRLTYPPLKPEAF